MAYDGRGFRPDSPKSNFQQNRQVSRQAEDDAKILYMVLDGGYRLVQIT
jgi:hypothetical protein